MNIDWLKVKTNKQTLAKIWKQEYNGIASSEYV